MFLQLVGVFPLPWCLQLQSFLLLSCIPCDPEALGSQGLAQLVQAALDMLRGPPPGIGVLVSSPSGLSFCHCAAMCSCPLQWLNWKMCRAQVTVVVPLSMELPHGSSDSWCPAGPGAWVVVCWARVESRQRFAFLLIREWGLEVGVHRKVLGTGVEFRAVWKESR